MNEEVKGEFKRQILIAVLELDCMMGSFELTDPLPSCIWILECFKTP